MNRINKKTVLVRKQTQFEKSYSNSHVLNNTENITQLKSSARVDIICES